MSNYDIRDFLSRIYWGFRKQCDPNRPFDEDEIARVVKASQTPMTDEQKFAEGMRVINALRDAAWRDAHPEEELSRRENKRALFAWALILLFLLIVAIF